MHNTQSTLCSNTFFPAASKAFGFLLCVVVLYWSQWAYADETALTIRVVARDGSVVSGRPADSSFEFEWAGGVLRIPLDTVISLTRSPAKPLAELSLHGGTRLSGIPRWSPIVLNSIIGELSIAMEDVERIHFSKSGYHISEELREGLLGYWPLDETEGRIISDRSGSGLHGALLGDVSLGAPGRVGKSARFRGREGSMIQIDAKTLPENTSVTLALWVLIPAEPTGGAFFKVGSADRPHESGSNGFGIGIGGGTFDESGHNLLAVFESVRWIDTGVVLTPGWQHVAMVIDGHGTPSFYINGAHVHTSRGNSARAPSSCIYIGGYKARFIQANGFLPLPRFFKGNIQKAALWSRALPPEQIRRLQDN